MFTKLCKYDTIVKTKEKLEKELENFRSDLEVILKDFDEISKTCADVSFFEELEEKKDRLIELEREIRMLIWNAK